MIASIWGRESGGRMTYNAVKAAEISLAKSMAQQLAGDGIRVNSVAPGSILFPGGSWDKRQQADPPGSRSS
jgi:3-oxoacyl-[acyl-carrier protein] reductase